MANPLPKKRCPHTPECTFGKSVEWLKEHMKPEDFHESRGSYCSCGNNPLGPEDYARMHLERELWDSDLSQVTADVREPTRKYLERIKTAKERRIGLYIFGDTGVGKSGVAAVVLKEARAWGYTAYATTVFDLREAVRARAALDHEDSVFGWCRKVDFLLLDDLRLSDIAEKFYTINDIRNLILGRHAEGLVTLITSPVPPSQWKPSGADGVYGAIEKTCAIISVTGPNRYRIRNEKFDILK